VVSAAYSVAGVADQSNIMSQAEHRIRQLLQKTSDRQACRMIVYIGSGIENGQRKAEKEIYV